MSSVTTVLRNATVVDGTGEPGFRADVACRDGVIVAVGAIGHDPSAVEVDLEGLVLAPGFVDIHTHYDAQVSWDASLSPSSWHGVTTVVQGNCGFGVAPVRTADRELAMETLSLVEGMRLDTLKAGLRWEYETFPEYLDMLRRLPKSINIAPMVPHTPLRIFVMGEEAAFSRVATSDECREMQRLLREAMHAGAIGFSTSQALSHHGPHGRPVPSRFADVDELRALLEVLADVGRGIAEITYGNILEIEDCARLSKETGVRITWGSVLPGLFGPPGAALEMLERGKSVEGGDIWPQTSTRFITTLHSMKNPNTWARVPTHQDVIGCSADVQMSIYADRAWRERVIAEGQVLCETTNFLDNKTGIGGNGGGAPTSEMLTLVERFTRVEDGIKYEAAIDDPKTFTRPWKIGMTFTTQAGYTILPYECHEGNRGLEDILSAARAYDRAVAEAVKNGTPLPPSVWLDGQAGNVYGATPGQVPVNLNETPSR